MSANILKNGIVKAMGNGIGANLLKYTKVNDANKTLLKNNISSKWNDITIETIDGYSAYKYPTAQSSTWFYSGQWFTPMEANTTYTYSAWIYFDVSSATNFNFTSLGHFQVYNANSTASDKSHEDVVASRIYTPSSIPAKTWTKIRITFTTNSLAGSYFQVYPRYNIGANTGDLYFRDCKLEKNNYYTPWIANSVDNEYVGSLQAFSENDTINMTIGSDYILSTEFNEVF